MRKVLLIAFVSAMSAMSTSAQEQVVAPALVAAQAQPAPPVPPAKPATAAPATPAAPAPPGTFKPVPAPVPSRLARNVRFDVTITDTAGPKPITKTVSVTIADNGSNGSIRNVARLSSNESGFNIVTKGPDGSPQVQSLSNTSFPLNLDVRGVTSYDDGSVRAMVNVEYQPYFPDAKTQAGVITASATAVFYDGRRTQILQSTDPLSDRRTTVDVTATILK